MSTPTRESRSGPLLMIGAAAFLTVMLATAQAARATLDPFTIIAFRSLVIVAVMLRASRRKSLRIHSWKALFVRTAFGLAAMSCFFTALKGISLTSFSLITKLQPVLVAVAAPLVLGAEERPSPLVWLAALLGFSGASLIVGFQWSGSWFYGVMALTGAAFSAVAHLALRVLSPHNPVTVIVFWYNAWLCAVAGFIAVSFFDGWQLVQGSEIQLLLLICGMTALGGQVFMTGAYARASAARVAAASYAAPVFALIGDVFFLDRTPTPADATGGLLVVASGGLLLYRAKHAAAIAPEPASAE